MAATDRGFKNYEESEGKREFAKRWLASLRQLQKLHREGFDRGLLREHFTLTTGHDEVK